MKFLHAFILALAGSVFLALAVFAGHVSVTAFAAHDWAAVPSGILATLMACAAVHLYAETFRALND